MTQIAGQYIGPNRNIMELLGFNVGLPSSAEWADPYQERGNLQSFYVANGASGVLSTTTGYPVSGDCKLDIQLRGGEKFADGNYTLSWTGGATFNSNSSPITLAVAGPDDSVSYNVSGTVSTFSMIPQAGTTGTYNSTFSNRADRGVCLRFMEAWRTNEDDASGAAYNTSHPYIRIRAVPGGNTFYHPSLTPTMIGNIGNTFDKDVWICFHHRASDTNITDAINQITATGFNNTIYCEFSNEVWNTGFPQRGVLLAEAIASGDYSGAPGDSARVAAYHADRTDEIGLVCKNAYTKCEVVLGCWTAVTNQWNQIKQYSLRYPFQFVDAGAINFYAGGPPSRALADLDAQNLTASGAETLIRDDWTTRVQPLITTWNTNLTTDGYRCIGYEGGPVLERDNLNSTEQAHYSTLAQSSEVGTVTGEIFQWWADNVGDVGILFQDVGNPSLPWSFLHGELGTTSPRWQEFLDRVR